MLIRKVILTAIVCLATFLGFAQFPGCPNIIAGPDQNLPCSQNCTNITATPFHAGATNTYTVASIPHAPPIAYNAAGGTAVSVGTDDVWSPIINLPFPFCYYGTTYTTCKVGSNGTIQLGPTAGGGGQPWAFTANCPSAALVNAGHIFGAYHDIDPSINTGSQSVRWYILGTAPCRIFVVSFNNIGHFSCTAMRTTQMIVLYETTNAIDVYIQRKDLCTGWNGGRAIVGIQNTAGTVGLAAPGRNAAPTWNVPAGTPEGWRFTPNGAPIYTVDWLQGATVIGTGNTINVCPNGATTTYTARVTYTRCDGLQIVETDDIVVSYANLPAPTVTPVAETCSGLNNGSVTINNAVGSGPYTVQINGPTTATLVEPNTPAGVANFTNLPDGNYTFTVTAANGCLYNGVFVINPGIACCSVTAVSTPALCFGQASGTATANPAGGVAPYSYQWFNAGMTPIGQITQTATGLVAGTYNVTITDNTGCTATVSIVVGQPAAALNATATPTNISCFGVCNGSILVNPPAGGTPGYQYSINGGALQAGSNFPGLCVGSYNMLVQDANGCQFPINAVAITQPTDVTLVQTAIAPATCGLNNGSVTVTAGGGTPGYTYSIGGTSNGTGIFTGLSAGPKVVNVTDANGCAETLNINIGTAAGPVPFVDVLNNVACAGALTGSVTIGVSGGTAPYTFMLDAGPGTQPGNTFNSVSAGAHSVTVTDANGCTGVVNFNITQPTALIFNTVVVNATCNGVCDGQITVNAGGATPPYEYSSNNGLSFQASNVLTGLCAGNINVVVRDGNGCLANAVVVVGQPTAVTAVTGVVDPQCHQTPTGSISFAPAGGTPGYIFSVDGGTTFVGASPITGLMAGIYDVVVQDNNGCQFTSQVTLTDPPPFSFTFIALNPSNCGAQDGSFEITADNGVGPYEYSIDGGTTVQNNGFFLNLFAGLYNLVVEDANGCKDSVYSALADSVMTTFLDGTQDATCFNGTDGMLFVSQINGAAPYSYTLTPTLLGGMSDFNFSGAFSGLQADTYYVTVQDNGLCIGFVTATINHPDSILFNTTLVPVTCNGGSDGQVNVTGVTGGNGGPYQYSIDGGPFQAGTLFTGLTAGNHTILVRDGNNCLGSKVVTVAQPTPFNVIVNATDLSCNGNNSGFIQVVAAGSNPGAYSYTVGVTNGTGLFPGLAAANHNITVTDVLGCTFNTTQVVNQPPLLVAGYVTTDALCNGACDGTVTVAAAGGTPTYLYSKDGGVTLQSSATLTGLCAGNHNIFVKDVNGCNILSAQLVGEPTAVSYSTVIIPSTCGLPNGEITINANGGTPAYSYSVDNGASFVAGNNFTGLAASNYNVVLQDQNGCEIGSIEEVLSETSPVITGVGVTNISCNGANDGELNVTANGGTGALMFDIGGVQQPSGLFTGLAPNNYVVTVTDANGCTHTQNHVITEPTVLSHVTVNSNLACFNDNSGSIDVNANGGTVPYLYSFNGGPFIIQDVADFLAAGNYNVEVQDANGCLSSSVQVITEPALLTAVQGLVTNVSCFDETDGTAEVIVAGGTAPYNYDWPGVVPAVNAANIGGLSAGGYSVDVTDANGCLAQTVFVITQPPMLAINSMSAVNTSCNGLCDGQITINSANAIEFSIDNGVTFVPGNVFTNLCGNAAGTIYDIVVRNINGCTQAAQLTIFEPTPIVLDPIADITICADGYGTLAATANGGSGFYYYIWDTGDTTQFLNIDNTMAPGTFTCTVHDATTTGCLSNPQSANTLILPRFEASVNPINLTVCPGDVAVFTAGDNGLGVPAYNYEWLSMALDTLGNGPTYSYIPTQAESLYLVGSDQCPSYDTLIVNVTFNGTPIPTFDPTYIGCAPLNAVFTNTTPNTMPGSEIWTFGDGNTGIGSPVSNVYMSPGTYSVTLQVTSIDGCIGEETYDDWVVVNDNPTPGFYWNPNSPSVLEPTITIVDVSEGAAFYQYNFAGLGTSSEQNPTFTFPETQNETTYSVCQTITSADGCPATLCLDVFVHEEIIFYIPNIFTPDGDPYNQVFKPEITSGVDIYDYHLTIFNRWGEIVFESFNVDYGWDGTYGDIGLTQDGVYVWQIEFGEKMTDKKQKHRGHVTVLK